MLYEELGKGGKEFDIAVDPKRKCRAQELQKIAAALFQKSNDFLLQSFELANRVENSNMNNIYSKMRTPSFLFY